MQQLDSFCVWLQVMQVLDAMPSSNLKPEDDEAKLEADRKYRTTYMFSATMPPTVERLAKKYLRRPVTITIGSAGRATDNVTQRVMLIKVGQGASKAPYQQRRLQDPCKLPSLSTSLLLLHFSVQRPLLYPLARTCSHGSPARKALQSHAYSVARGQVTVDDFLPARQETAALYG